MPSEPVIIAASSERMSPKRFSVSEDVEAARLAHEQHRAGVDELVRELDVGVVLRDLVHDLHPELRHLEDVGLVRRASRGSGGARADSNATRVMRAISVSS